MKTVKADLVPTEANLLGQYGSFAELEALQLALSEPRGGADSPPLPPRARNPPRELNLQNLHCLLGETGTAVAR